MEDRDGVIEEQGGAIMEEPGGHDARQVPARGSVLPGIFPTHQDQRSTHQSILCSYGNMLFNCFSSVSAPFCTGCTHTIPTAEVRVRLAYCKRDADDYSASSRCALTMEQTDGDKSLYIFMRSCSTSNNT